MQVTEQKKPDQEGEEKGEAGLVLDGFSLPVLLKEVVAIKVEPEGDEAKHRVGKPAEPVEAFEVTLKAVVTDGTLVWLTQGLQGHKIMMTVKIQNGAET